MSEYHIASYIIRCYGEFVEQTAALIEAINGTEVHAKDANGKMIVTVEGNSHRDVANTVEALREIPHVVDIAAVYHEYTNTSFGEEDLV